MTDRIAGHVGACLAMDWRGNYAADGAERAEGGWVVTGGMDRTIKIWDFSQPILQNRPVRTLYSSQPVHDVAWHPTRGTEIASSPMPALGTLLRGAPDPDSGGSSASLDAAKERATSRSFWKNEIEIWDTRRAFFPKLSIETDEPVSGERPAEVVETENTALIPVVRSNPLQRRRDDLGDFQVNADVLPVRRRRRLHCAPGQRPEAWGRLERSG